MWKESLDRIIVLPRSSQPDAFRALREKRETETSEEWNQRFGPESLYDAWSETPLMRGLYKANRAVIRPFLDHRKNWRIVEIGGGNGALWRNFFLPEDRGEFCLIDPVSESHDAVRSIIPSHLAWRSHAVPIEEASIPEADLVVCSLTLHHVPGIDREQCRKYGIDGPGKWEILRKFIEAIRPRNGLCILNEADIHIEIDLSPDDPVLIDRLTDSYVRRCALAIADAMDRPDMDPDLKRRWTAIIIHWCIDQIDKAHASLKERDVYELDTPRWLTLIEGAGAIVQSHRFTDEWNLFHQYVFGARR